MSYVILLSNTSRLHALLSPGCRYWFAIINSYLGLVPFDRARIVPIYVRIRIYISIWSVLARLSVDLFSLFGPWITGQRRRIYLNFAVSESGGTEGNRLDSCHIGKRPAISSGSFFFLSGRNMSVRYLVLTGRTKRCSPEVLFKPQCIALSFGTIYVELFPILYLYFCFI